MRELDDLDCDAEPPARRSLDWRIAFGLAVSVLWIGFGLFYIFVIVGFDRFAAQSISEIGGFLEGAFAPLAFLWLVLGLFLQQREISINTDQLRRSLALSRRQTDAIAATELNARQEAFFKIAISANQQLGTLAGMLLISVKGAAGDGSIASERINEWWRQIGSGDHQVFARQLLTLQLAAGETWHDFFFGTEIRRNHSNNLMDVFEKLVRLANDCDIDGIIRGSLEQTGHGLLYRRIRTMKDEGPATQERHDAP